MSTQEPEGQFTTAYTLWFMVILSVICALILSLLASALAKPQEIAQDLDRSKQMMIAARMLNHQGQFLVPGDNGSYRLGRYEGGALVASSTYELATQE